MRFQFLQKISLLTVYFLINMSPTIFCSNNVLDGQMKVDIQNLFYNSGWMGDGEYGRKYIEYNGAFEVEPHSEPTSTKIKYTFGPNRWAGIYWQNKPDNWGDKPGNNYANAGFKRITFWAKGATGKEVVEFKAGGTSDPNKPYSDSFETSIGRISLQREWNKYTIDLEHMDLSSVIGGFCWVASQDYNNSKSITFFIDDILMEK